MYTSTFNKSIIGISEKNMDALRILNDTIPITETVKNEVLEFINGVVQKKPEQKMRTYVNKKRLGRE